MDTAGFLDDLAILLQLSIPLCSSKAESNTILGAGSEERKV